MMTKKYTKFLKEIFDFSHVLIYQEMSLNMSFVYLFYKILIIPFAFCDGTSHVYLIKLSQQGMMFPIKYAFISVIVFCSLIIYNVLHSSSQSLCCFLVFNFLFLFFFFKENFSRK